MWAAAYHQRITSGANNGFVLASCLAPGPLPPPPPMSRNGSISRALPAAPQLPSRAGLDSQRGGPRPPLPPDRPGSAAPPPPPPLSSAVRNGFQDPGDGKPSSQSFAFDRDHLATFGLEALFLVHSFDFWPTEVPFGSQPCQVRINTPYVEQNCKAVNTVSKISLWKIAWEKEIYSLCFALLQYRNMA